MLVLFLYVVHSVKPVVEKAPLVIPLIQQNRWLNARKPEDLETEDGNRLEKTALKVAAIEQTGDKVTDTAVQEILGGNNSLFSIQCLGHVFNIHNRIHGRIRQAVSPKGQK